MQANVNRALIAVGKAQEQHALYLAEIAALRKGLPKKRDAGRAVLLPLVANFYGVAVVDGQGKAKGQKVLDSGAAKYEAARKALQSMVADIYVGASRTELEVPADVLAAAEKLAKLCNEYKNARKLASTAVAAVFSA